MDWRMQALGGVMFNSQFPFSEFVVLISANLMWHRRVYHWKWIPASCIGGASLKTGDITHTSK